MLLSPPLVSVYPVLPPTAAFRSTPRVPAPLVLPAPSPPAPSTTQGSTFKDLCGEEWELNDEEIAALDLQGAASPMEVEGELPDMNAEEMAKEGFYLVKSVLRHRYRQGWRFLTLWKGLGVEEATWEPFSAFVLPEGRLNSVLVDYLSQNNLGELLRLAETLASKTKARD